LNPLTLGPMTRLNRRGRQGRDYTVSTCTKIKFSCNLLRPYVTNVSFH
jgi:hypothetical protein